MKTLIRTFKRGDQMVTIAPVGKGLFDISTNNHTMTLDAHAVDSFISSAKMIEVTNYYPPPYINALAWISIAKQIPDFKKNLYKNQFKLNYMPDKMLIDPELFEQMTQACALHEIAGEKIIKKVILFNGNEYIITSTCSNNLNGYVWVTAHRVVPIEKYKGKLEPLSYDESLNDRLNGNRPIGYEAMKISDGSRTLVLIGPLITFYPLRPDGTHDLH